MARQLLAAVFAVYVFAVCAWGLADQFRLAGPTLGPWYATWPASIVLVPVAYYFLLVPLDLLIGAPIDPNPSASPGVLGIAVSTVLWSAIAVANASLVFGMRTIGRVRRCRFLPPCRGIPGLR